MRRTSSERRQEARVAGGGRVRTWKRTRTCSDGHDRNVFGTHDGSESTCGRGTIWTRGHRPRWISDPSIQARDVHRDPLRRALRRFEPTEGLCVSGRLPRSQDATSALVRLVLRPLSSRLVLRLAREVGDPRANAWCGPFPPPCRYFRVDDTWISTSIPLCSPGRPPTQGGGAEWGRDPVRPGGRIGRGTGSNPKIPGIEPDRPRSTRPVSQADPSDKVRGLPPRISHVDQGPLTASQTHPLPQIDAPKTAQVLRRAWFGRHRIAGRDTPRGEGRETEGE